MTRKEAAEEALWEGILAAWHDDNFHRAKELEAHLSEIEGFTVRLFDLSYPEEPHPIGVL